MIWYFIIGLILTGMTLGLSARNEEEKNKRDPKWMWASIGAVVAMVWPIVLVYFVYEKMKGKR